MTVAHASKGIVLDGSVGTVIEGSRCSTSAPRPSTSGRARAMACCATRTSTTRGATARSTARACTWDRRTRTGRSTSAQSAGGTPKGDNTERVLIEDNVFEDVTARARISRRAPKAGRCGAMCSVARASRGRTARTRRSMQGQQLDHRGQRRVGDRCDVGRRRCGRRASSWTGSSRTRSKRVRDRQRLPAQRVVGAIPGFGVGLYPAFANVVTCDNTALGAARAWSATTTATASVERRRKRAARSRCPRPS